MALMAGPLWLLEFDYASTILFAALIIYVAGYFFGGLTGICISKRSPLAILFGIAAGFAMVWTATFFGSLIGFIKEGLQSDRDISATIHEYIYKPMVLVTIFGFPQIILIGIWFGLSIKKQIDPILNE